MKSFDNVIIELVIGEEACGGVARCVRTSYVVKAKARVKVKNTNTEVEKERGSVRSNDEVLIYDKLCSFFFREGGENDELR